MADSALSAVQALDVQRRRLVDEYVNRASNMWRSLTPADWWNDAVTEGAAAYVTQQQIAFVKAMRRCGITYADIMLRLVMVQGLGEIPEYEVVRDNTDPWKVSLRAADAYRSEAVKSPDIRPEAWDRLDGNVAKTVQGWLDAAKGQLENNAVTDGNVAANRATQQRYESSGVTRYRRIIHPELSKTGTCGLCVVAATNTFTRGDLMPMHNRCRCTVAPITAEHDPGLKLNDSDLMTIYKAAGKTAGKSYSTNATDLTKLRVQVTNNSELGPVLLRKDAPVNEGVAEWHLPDMKMTQRQMERMFNRATEFDAHYRQLLEGSSDSVRFRYDGRTYNFKKSAHTKQAWDYVRSLLSYSRGFLGLAA